MDLKPKVLIIDDEEVVLDSCRRILTTEGVQVFTADGGEKGLCQVRESAPDLVFVDLKMPGLSGLEVIDGIRKVDPDIVVIVITGYSTVASAVDSLKRGAYDFLPKPFTPDEFRLITRRGLERRRLALEAAALRREKELLRENFAAILSHELKSPLAALQQSLYALTAAPPAGLAEADRERLRRMQARVDDLLKMIHTWLRAMSSDLDSIRTEFQSVDLGTVAARAVETVEPYARRKGIRIAVEKGPVPAVVRGHEGTLVEAMVNLLDNAVKYSRPGEEVTVRICREGDRAQMAVVDHGVGMSPEDRRMIFEGFGRSQDGTGGEKGHGFGLALVRRIAEVHGGTLTGESELGRGSTFRICLPAVEEKPAG